MRLDVVLLPHVCKRIRKYEVSPTGLFPVLRNAHARMPVRTETHTHTKTHTDAHTYRKPMDVFIGYIRQQC